MEPDLASIAKDCECKLNALRLLRQALDNGLISEAQYTFKQEEFLNTVKFHPTQEHLDTHLKVAIKVQEMEDDLERALDRRVRRPSPYTSSSDRKRLRRALYTHANDEQFRKLHELCNVSYDSPYEYGNGAARYATFSEFICFEILSDHQIEIYTRYDAVRALGGSAILKTIYKYAYDHQSDIDTKYAYRFRDNEYKSNVRSTLHNTGAFSKMPTGEWTITGKLKSRKY